jgi:hypothetical protein
VVVVAAVIAAATLARADVSGARVIAGWPVVIALSVMVWLLATTPGDALRLPVLVSEVVVLGGMFVVVLLATGRVGFCPLVVVLVAVAGHVRERPGSVWPRWRAEPWPKNPWRLAPALWHPALWLTALHPVGSSLAWAGLGLCVAAAAGTLLAGSAGFWVRGLGLALWAVVGAVTLRLLL